MRELYNKQREKLEANQQPADENLADVEGAGPHQLSMNQLILLLMKQLMLQYHQNMMQCLKLHNQPSQSLQLGQQAKDMGKSIFEFFGWRFSN